MIPSTIGGRPIRAPRPANVGGVPLQRAKPASRLGALIRRRPALSYYVLTFAVSWGGFLLVGGRGLVAGTGWQADPAFMYAVVAMLAGPLVAGPLLTALTHGQDGLRKMASGLLTWRVSARWYVAALLPAPVTGAAVLLALSLTSPAYLPAIVTTADRTGLLLAAVLVGLVGGLVEEIGWTGFAIPSLRLHHGVLHTALIVGVLWGAWHLLQMFWVGRTSSGALPLALFLAQYFVLAIAALTAYRVLMVWVYDRTESLLVALLMHASYIATTLFVLAPPTVGLPYLIYAWVWAAALWGVVAVVARVNGRWLARPALRQPVT